MIAPMLCKPEKPFNDNRYSFEIKYDGERALLFLANGKLTIQNRRGDDVTYRYPELKEIANGKAATLDGEVVIFDETGKSSFDLLAQRSHIQRKFDIEIRSKKLPVVYVCFDILSFDGQDITRLPLSERRSILYREFKPIFNGKIEIFRWSLPLDKEGKGIALFEQAKELNLEGLVAKLDSSPYLPGKRSPYWKKMKNIKTADVTVTAYRINPSGIRVENADGFGCQVAGYHAKPVKERIDKQGYAVIEVNYLNLTAANNRMRMPTYKGLKDE